MPCVDILKFQAAAKKLARPRPPPHAPAFAVPEYAQWEVACAWFPNTEGEGGSQRPRGGGGASLPRLCPRAQNGGGLGTKSPRQAGRTPRPRRVREETVAAPRRGGVCCTEGAAGDRDAHAGGAAGISTETDISHVVKTSSREESVNARHVTAFLKVCIQLSGYFPANY